MAHLLILLTRLKSLSVAQAHEARVVHLGLRRKHRQTSYIKMITKKYKYNAQVIASEGGPEVLGCASLRISCERKETKGAFTLRPFYFSPKQMILSKSIYIIALGHCVYNALLLSRSKLTSSQSFPYSLPSMPHACWSYFALWGSIVTTQTN